MALGKLSGLVDGVFFLGWGFWSCFMSWTHGWAWFWGSGMKAQRSWWTCLFKYKYTLTFLIKYFCAISFSSFPCKWPLLLIFGVNVCNVYLLKIKDPFGNKAFLGLKGLSLCVSFLM